jgi:large subunit ribosomal protein L17
MRHMKRGKKLGRNASHRKALMRNMAVSLFRHERIETTEAKAKVLKSFAERIITLAKRGDLHARRLVAADINDKQMVQKLFQELGPRFAERNGGYTRVLKLGHRKGDAAPMALVELTDTEVLEKKKQEKEEKATRKRIEEEESG